MIIWLGKLEDLVLVLKPEDDLTIYRRRQALLITSFPLGNGTGAEWSCSMCQVCEAVGPQPDLCYAAVLGSLGGRRKYVNAATPSGAGPAEPNGVTSAGAQGMCECCSPLCPRLCYWWSLVSVRWRFQMVSCIINAWKTVKPDSWQKFRPLFHEIYSKSK